jgi:hypothetical protein
MSSVTKYDKKSSDPGGTVLNGAMVQRDTRTVHTGKQNNEPDEGKAQSTTTRWRPYKLPYGEVTLECTTLQEH